VWGHEGIFPEAPRGPANWLQISAFCDTSPLKRPILPVETTDVTRMGFGRIMRSGVRTESEAIMKSRYCAGLLLFTGCCLMPAWAAVRLADPVQGLRLPTMWGTDGWMPAAQIPLWFRASGSSGGVSFHSLPPLPALRWRVEQPRFFGKTADSPLMLERSRTAVTAHWQPWALGAWKLGASMGLSRALPGPSVGTTTFTALPMASYEERNYRVNLGLVAPQGERQSTLFVGLSVPLR